jgi:hypothetical protein
MNDIKVLIKEVENEWLDLLYKQVKSIFKNYPIPSHSEHHHLRVWNYAVKLVEELYKKGTVIESTDLENLIIAVFFHDTGLIQTRGRDHGKSGVGICKKWLEENSLISQVDSQKIFYAIEHHDNKVYLSKTPLSSEGKINLLGILGICDDLDAFGYCGIYRYTEIYLLRGTALEELGQQVISNVCVRFGNFLHQCIQFPDIIKIHTLRYGITEQFFKDYNAQLRKDPFGRTITSGPFFIVRFIYRQLLNLNYSVDKLCELGMKRSTNKSDREFFVNLKKDWLNLI